MEINNSYLKNYIDQNFKLIQTATIKFNDQALLINEGLAAKYGKEIIDPYVPASWKYYLNISGQYHPTDTIMRVVSIDTLQEIDFTKENLEIHTSTAEAYRFGTRHYYSLIGQYPTQLLLIHGILYPTDLQTALEAEDGTIVSYQKDLVEENELSLIQDLQSYIQRLIDRWYNKQFNFGLPLYFATFFASLVGKLVSKLLNLRLNRIHTYEAHSFHVRMYLASHNGLDRYLPYLTLKQSLFLYRNIRYIERNAGVSEQLTVLIDRLLTERGIPIGEYLIKQTDTFENYYPVPAAEFKLLNTKVNANLDQEHSLEDLFTREMDAALDNPEYFEKYGEQIRDKFEVAPRNHIKSKVLHSPMVDYSNAVPEPFEMVALRQWCYMANKDLYPVYISFKDPKTTISYSLSAKDAFLYLYYLLFNQAGVPITEIPKFFNYRQRKHPKPTVEELLSVTDYKRNDFTSLAVNILNGQPSIQTVYSVTAFNSLTYQIYQEAYRHWFIISSIGDYYDRALVENMINQLYEDEVYGISVEETSITDWLARTKLPEYNYNFKEASELMVEIYQAAAGVNDDPSKEVKNIQAALLSLMSELCSYSVQFTKTINSSDIILVNPITVRFGNNKESTTVIRPIEPGVSVLEFSGDGATSETYVLGSENALSVQKVAVDFNITAEVDFTPDIQQTTEFVTTISDLSTPFDTELSYLGQDEVVDTAFGVVGYTTFDSLTETQRKSLKSVYL